MVSILLSPWSVLAQAVVALVGTWLLAFGLKSVRETDGFDTRNPSPQSWRFLAGLVLVSLSLLAAGLTPFAAGKATPSLPATSPPSHATTGSSLPSVLAPVNAKDLWNLRSACARLGEKILEGNIHGAAVSQQQESHYNLSDGRCYVRLDVTPVDLDGKGAQYRTYLLDGQTNAQVAWTISDAGERRGCSGWSQEGGSDSCDRSSEIIAAKMHN